MGFVDINLSNYVCIYMYTSICVHGLTRAISIYIYQSNCPCIYMYISICIHPIVFVYVASAVESCIYEDEKPC